LYMSISWVYGMEYGSKSGSPPELVDNYNTKLSNAHKI
jgi:hypothetical protein